MNQPLVYGGFTFYQSSYDEFGRRQAGVGSHGGLRSGQISQVSWLPHDMSWRLRRVLRESVFVPHGSPVHGAVRRTPPAQPRQSSSWLWRCWRAERHRRLPARAVSRRSIGASGDRCRCKKAAARSRWIRWPGRPSARSATSRVSPTRRRNRSLIPPRFISPCFSPGRAGIGRQALTACRAPKVARGSPPHISLTPGTASRCCWSTRPRCAPRWGCRPTRSTSPSSISPGRRSSFRRPARRASSSPGRKSSFATGRRSRTSWKGKAWTWPSGIGRTRTSAAGRNSKSCRFRDSKMQQWISVARLMQTNWDDKTDADRRDSQGESRTAKGPGGLSGKCRRGFQRGVGKLPCRAAARSARSWATIPRPRSSTWKWPTTTGRRSASPGFALCWRCCGMLLSWTSRWRPFYWAALAFYGAGVLAMLVGFGHAHGNRRAGAGHQHVRIGGVRRLGDRRVGAGFRTRLSQVLRADGRGGRLHPGADAGRHLPGNPRPQHPSVDAGAAEQLLAGHPRDDHHAQLRRFCPGAVDRQYRARVSICGVRPNRAAIAAL